MTFLGGYLLGAALTFGIFAAARMKSGEPIHEDDVIAVCACAMFWPLAVAAVAFFMLSQSLRRGKR